MIQFNCRSAVFAGIVALLVLCPPASVLAETSATRPAPVSKPSLVPTVTREQALALLKRYFPVPDGPGKVEASLSSRGSRLMWEITVTADRSVGGLPAARGEIDAHSGQIRMFRRIGQGRGPIPTGPLPAPRPEAAARSRAELLVRELYPSQAATLRLAPHLPRASVLAPDDALADDYRFSWVQYHGDIPVFAGPAVTVSVDKNTLDYTELSASFPTLTFPAGAAKVTPAEALKLYRQALVPSLAYQPVLDGSPMSDGVSAIGLIYRIERTGVVDAISGQLVDASGQVIPARSQSEPVPAGTGPSVKAQLPLNNDSAIALATELVGLPAGAHLELNAGGAEELLEFYSASAGGSVSVSVDPTTGLINHALRYKDTPYPENENPVATAPPDTARQAEAKAVAIALVQRYYSPLLAELKLETHSAVAADMGSGYGSSFFFQRYVNGIPVGMDGVFVSIDPDTRTWTDISMHWTTRVAFPKVEGAITVAEASDRFFAGQEPLLVYALKEAPGSAGYGGFISYMDETARPQATMLVYQLDADAPFPGYGMLDARTGQPVDWRARPRSVQAEALKGLSGHRAEGELRYMLSRRALTPEQLNPEAPLNRGDALQMLVMGQRGAYFYSGGQPAGGAYTDVKQGDSLYKVVQDGIRRGVLQPQGENPVFSAGQPITRAEFAVWLARTLKLDQLGRSGLVTISTFTDLAALSVEERNAAAFLQALGIAGGGEAFRGSAQLTQAEAAAFTVRLLNHLSANR